MSSVAQRVIWPRNSQILVRIVFLYVGQGDSTLVLVRDGETYKTILVDINRDEKHGGIDVPRLIKDLLKEKGGKLTIFANTHPHDDHLRDVIPLSESVDIQEVWHSGHKPGKKYEDAYQDLQKVIKKVTKKYGAAAETELSGSRTAIDFGEAQYHVLAPADHVKDDINDESADDRYRRIHEQCVVLKFGQDETWVMLTGDAERDAWEKYIMYHEERLPSKVVTGAHHGSRTFFCYSEDDDPYLDALQAIAPEYVVLSAPTAEESPHGHPHKDAVALYEDEVGVDNVLHMGKNRECFVCDIFDDGDFAITTDTKLVDEYGLDGEGGKQETKSSDSRVRVVAPAVVTGTHIDRRPMGRIS